MESALLLAERGLGRTSPNPVVGALVVSPDGVVLGTGYHERAGEPHAEVHALRAAGDRARGATLYCTLEPCCHMGRTGPCVERIVAAGIARVVAAVEDPNPLVSGQGFAYLRAHAVVVDVGVGRKPATLLNQPFFTWVRKRRPFVVLKAATSLDGYIAASPGVRTRITSGAALRRAQRLRAEVDSVGVGSGTILTDDPLLTVRELYRELPLVRVVFDRRLRTPPTARVLSTIASGPVVIMASPLAIETDGARANALREAGAEVDPAGGTLETALRRLADLGVTSLSVEGGAILHGAFWDRGLVDFVQLFVSPTKIGPGGVGLLPGRAFSVAALADAHAETCGVDVVITGYVHRTC
jgi:diaminohydroxyphosphoribosylaminopyrimidine deaminase / 5-amino-6-(5-phosphoribosylamino)uracil reductase